MKKTFCNLIVLGLIMTPVSALAVNSPHNASNLIDSFRVYFPDGTSFSKGDCAGCHYTNYTSRCETCHTNTTGGGYSNMTGWDDRHEYVTDSAPFMASHRDLSCGDCHYPGTHSTGGNIFDYKLVTGTFPAASVTNTLISTETWYPAPDVWLDVNGDPGLGVLQEQWTSTLTLPAGYSVLHTDWTDPATWMEKTGPERGLILGIISSSGGFDDDGGSFEVEGVIVNPDSSVTLTVKGKLVLASLYNVNQTTPAFALFYNQMLKHEVGYCDDPLQPGLQIDTANPQICFHLMGGNQYGTSNCPDNVDCIPQAVRFAGPSDFAKTDNLGAAGIDASPDGICQACHLNTNHWRRDGSMDDGHYSGQRCTDCHDHKKGFQPDCTLCHAIPPVDGAGMVYSTDAQTVTANVTGSSVVGAHALHATASGYNYSCDSCHQGGMPDSSYSGNNKIQIGFGVNPVGTAATYDGQASLAAPFGYEGIGGVQVTTGGSLVCSNVYCHSNGSSVSGGAMNSNSTPAWDASGPLACDSCHAYPVMSYAGTDARKDTHGRHAQAGYASCEICHYQTTIDGLTINDRATHANMAYDVAPAPTFSARGVDVPLNFNYVFEKSGGTCSSNSCHAYWGYSDPALWGMNIDLKVIPQVSGLASLDTDRVVTFDASRSSCYQTVAGANIALTCSYDWDFGGNGTIVGGNGIDKVTYQYQVAGDYTVKLTMAEANTGKRATDSITVTAQVVEPPVAAADFSTTVIGRTVTVTATLPADVVRANIYWGDRKKTLSSSPQTELVNGISHTYASGGQVYSLRIQTIDASYNSLNYTVSEDGDLAVTVP